MKVLSVLLMKLSTAPTATLVAMNFSLLRSTS